MPKERPRESMPPRRTLLTDAASARGRGPRSVAHRDTPAGGPAEGPPTNAEGRNATTARTGRETSPLARPQPPRTRRRMASPFRFSLQTMLLLVVCLAGVMTAGSLLVRALRQGWAAEAAGQDDPGNGQTWFFFLIAAMATPAMLMLAVSIAQALLRRAGGSARSRRRGQALTDPLADADPWSDSETSETSTTFGTRGPPDMSPASGTSDPWDTTSDPTRALPASPLNEPLTPIVIAAEPVLDAAGPVDAGPVDAGRPSEDADAAVPTDSPGQSPIPSAESDSPPETPRP